MPHTKPMPGRIGALVFRDGVVNTGPYAPVASRGIPSLSLPHGMMRDVVPAAVSTNVGSASQRARAITPLYVPPAPHGPYVDDQQEALPSFPTAGSSTPLPSTPQPSAPDQRSFLPLRVSASGSLLKAAEHLPANVPVLPWIDSFLSITPTLPMPSIADTTAWAADLSPDLAASLPSDNWALKDAVQQMRELANVLTVQDRMASNRISQPRLLTSRVDPVALVEWRAGSSARPNADGLPIAYNEGVEAAARALEVLAGRVRDGKISLAHVEPRLGDEAALAAALATLLGDHR